MSSCPAQAVPHTAGEGIYPGKSWQWLSEPGRSGWSREKLKAARDYTATIDTAAVMVVVAGQILDEWGQTATRFNVHSVRKSLLSALYGEPVRNGLVKLSGTLAELDIDDNEPSLTPIEKTATVRDLLEARSGIYHPALYEPEAMKASRPPRGSHAPGTFWHYNNWDFNALGTIFERQTETRIFDAFKARIADPIGMEDFRAEDGSYFTGPESIHPAYPFRMTARDMARFGLLFLREGVWRGRQIIPADWVKESTTPYSVVPDPGGCGGYGYMWWVNTRDRGPLFRVQPEGAYSAAGTGMQLILVVPQLELVIVHRVNTDNEDQCVRGRELLNLVHLIMEAGPPYEQEGQHAEPDTSTDGVPPLS